MATWITPGSSRSVKLDGTRTRRHTIGLIPVSQNLTWRIASASAARFSVGTRGFGRRFMLPDYCLSASPSPDTPEILMLSRPDSARTKGRGQGRLQGAQPHDRSRHARLSKARLKPPEGPPLPPDLRLCTNANASETQRPKLIRFLQAAFPPAALVSLLPEAYNGSRMKS